MSEPLRVDWFHVAARAANWPFLLFGAAVVTAALAAAWAFSRARGGRLLERFNASERTLPRAMAALAGVYFLVYSYLSILRYTKNLHGSWDTGIFESLMTNALGGRFFQDYRGAFDHLNLTLAFYMPFYALWQDGRLLLVLQSAAVALAVWPLYLLAREVSGRASVAAVVGIAYLLHPLLGMATLYDFHGVSTSPIFFFAMLLFMRRQRWLPYWIFLALTLATKESESIVVLGAGLYLLSRRNWLQGALTAAAAVAWGALAVYVLIPGLSGEGFRHFNRYEGIAATVKWGVFDSLGQVHAAAFAARAAAVTLFCLLPMGFLAARRWRPFVLVLGPTLAVNMLSKVAFQNVLFGHYAFTAMSAAFGAAALAAEGLLSPVAPVSPDEAASGPRPSRWPVFILVSAALSNVLLSFPANVRWTFPPAFLEMGRAGNVLSMPLPVTPERRAFYRVTPEERFLLASKRILPPGATIATQNEIGYIFADRFTIHDLSYDVSADYYVFNIAIDGGFTEAGIYNALFARLESDPGIVRFIDLSTPGRPDRPGRPGLTFYATGARAFEFYNNALAAHEREPDNASYAFAVAAVERTLGIRRSSTGTGTGATAGTGAGAGAGAR